MKLFVCAVTAVLVLSGIILAQDPNAASREPSQQSIVQQESQIQAQQGQRNIQQEQQWRQSHPGLMYGAKDANAPGRQMVQQRAQERIAELKRIRDLAQSENATKTVAALDKLIAHDEQMMKQMKTRMEQRRMRGMEHRQANHRPPRDKFHFH